MLREITNIAIHEFKKSHRNLGLKVLVGVLSLFFITSVLSSYYRQKNNSQEIQALQRIVNENWQDQPDRHPHRVSHYGSIAFREPSVLSFFDIGVSDYSGNSIFLEAHVQNTSNLSETSQSSALMRFGRLTPSFILLIILPLLIVFQSGVSITKEKESRTLGQVLSLGVSWKTFLLGKFIGNSALFIFALLSSVILVTITGFTIGHGYEFNLELITRIGLLSIVYVWYILVWIIISLTVSAYCQKSSSSIAILMGVWIIFVTFMPKSLPSLGALLYSAPARPIFEHQIHSQIVQGGHGHNAKSSNFENKKKELFAKYGVSKVEDLPINWRGIAMKEGEKFSAQVYSKNYKHLADIFSKQNTPLDIASAINPMLLARNLSSAICFTDYYASTEFERQAEDYRFQMMQKLNSLHTDHIKYDGDKKQRVSARFWKDFKPFAFKEESIKELISRKLLMFLGMLFYFVFAMLIYLKSPRRIV